VSVSGSLRRAARELCRELADHTFPPPVTHVYNPLEYAWRPHAEYLKRYLDAPVSVVYLGMNPGPFGMAQTGVPFGEISQVRDWLGIELPVAKPPREHPKRPVEGFGCTRSEVSGARLWGAIARHYRTPEAFFAHAAILNYCPLVFMEASGRNLTPNKLAKAEAARLFDACDRHLRRAVRALAPRWVVGIGEFAASRARVALLDRDVQIGQILHPSPASPRANRDWAGEVERQLRALGVCAAAPGRRPRARPNEPGEPGA